MSSCCLKGFKWDGAPTGREASINGQDCYVAGSNPDVAIIVIHDLYGWTFPNVRLLADHYAAEVGATVYVPDLCVPSPTPPLPRNDLLTSNSFGGVVLPPAIIDNPPEWDKLDLPTFMARNSKQARAPEMAALAKFLRTQHRRLGAIGFCYGGWAVFQLGARVAEGEVPLVDCISTAHPTFLEEEEMLRVGVPVQILAPERDPKFTEELKAFAVKEIPKLGVAFDYQYFPGLEHGFAVRGNRKDEAETRGLERAMRAAVGWFREWLVEA